MVLRPLEIFLLLQCGNRLYSSESDVYRRQILMTKVDPHAVRVKASSSVNLSATRRLLDITHTVCAMNTEPPSSLANSDSPDDLT